MALRVVYIADNGRNKIKRERKLSEKEMLRREGIAAIAAFRIRAREKAENKFTELDKEIEQLRKRRDELDKCANS